MSGIPINRKILDYSHAFPMVAEFSGPFTFSWIVKFQPYTSALLQGADNKLGQFLSQDI